MQNELTNTVQEKFLRNPHLANHVRTHLRQRLAGCDTALDILDNLSNSQLVAKYLAHHATKMLTPEEVRATSPLNLSL